MLYMALQETDSQGSAHQEDSGAFVHSPDANGSQSSPQFTSKRRSRDEAERPPLLRLEILSGPSSGRDVTIDDAGTQVRLPVSPYLPAAFP